MNIKELRPIPMAEAREILKVEETEKAKIAEAFIKKFTKISGEEAKKMFDAIKKTTDDARDNNDLCRTNMNPEQIDSWENPKEMSRNAFR